MAATIVGKLFIMPALGFFFFGTLSNLRGAPALHEQLPTDKSGLESELSVLAHLAHLLWPADKLLRSVLIMQWSAPSCLGIMVLCHRAGLDDGVVQALSLSYLAMYGLTLLTTTLWLSGGLSLF